jgi:hypothetical protein
MEMERKNMEKALGKVRGWFCGLRLDEGESEVFSSGD